MRSEGAVSNFWPSFWFWLCAILALGYCGTWLGPVAGGVISVPLILVALFLFGGWQQRRERAEQAAREEAAEAERERFEEAVETAVGRALRAAQRTNSYQPPWGSRPG